jgi:undecaprenyl-diphosphatase
MMWIEKLDHNLLVSINNLHTPFLDEFMWSVSLRLAWIPFYLFLIYLSLRKLNRKGVVLFLCFIVVAIILSDIISVHGFKNTFLRYRPSHNLLISKKLHYYQQADGSLYKGGLYGFVSSHATNFGALATGTWFVLGKFYKWLAIILISSVFIVCFSRVYLGVHFPSDVLIGGIVGSFVSLLLYKCFFEKMFVPNFL